MQRRHHIIKRTKSWIPALGSSPAASPSQVAGMIFLILILGTHSSASWNRNDAHLNWKTAETEHFRFYYDKSLEDVAEYAAGIAEDSYGKIVSRYNITMPGKIEFVLRDDVISNGFANPYQNTMQIWISDWGIPLRSSHNWLRDVITHEFSHLVSIQAGSKLPTSIIGLVVGYEDYYNENVQSSGVSVIPFSSQPNWFAEGVAQYESSRAGYDAWDSHRDMIIRTAALTDSLLSYAQMCSFSGKGLHWEQGPYTQGFSFVMYLIERYGDDAVIRLWAENSRIHRQTLSGAMKRVLGKSGPELWEDWKNQTTRVYHEKVKGLGKLVEGEKLSKNSFFNHYPKWNHQGNTIFFISNKGKEGFGGSLYKYQLADTVKDGEKTAFVSGGIRGYFDIHPDDSTFLYASARDKDKNGIATLDIYQKKVIRKSSFFDFGKDKTSKRITKDLNAFKPGYSPDGKQTVFARNKLSNFYLCTAPVPEGEQNEPDQVKTIFPPEEFLKGKFGFNIYSPKFSPDGRRILFSFYNGISRNIGLIDADGRNFKPILNHRCDERDPDWHPDGKSFVFSSDSTGIFNLYAYYLENDSVAGVTNVSGGAFSPAFSPDGKNIAYVNYDVDGFSLYLLRDWKPVEGTTRPGNVIYRDTCAIESIEFSGVREKYSGIPNRFIYQPILIGQEMSSIKKDAITGEPKWLAGLSVFGNDPVYKNEIVISALFELGKGLDYIGPYNDLLNPDKESQLYFNFWNNSLPVSIGLSLMRRNIVTWDIFVDQSQGTLDTSKSNQAVVLKSAQLSLKYNLFETELMSDPLKTSFLSLTFGRDWSQFDFYEIPFDFTFYKNLYIAPSLWYYGVVPSSKSEIAPIGIAAFCNYALNFSNLIRGGSFRETFTIDENGRLKENFKDFRFHEMDLGLDYGISVPWSAYSSLRLEAVAGTILDWERTDETPVIDTLDSYFQRGLLLRGYPYLLNTEELLFRGENTMRLSADLNQVIIPNIYRKYWIFFIEDLYAQLFWEAGRAWDGKVHDLSLFDPGQWNERKNYDAWYQSVGWGIKLKSKAYYNYPFSVYFEAATALNQVPENAQKGAKRSLKDLDQVELFGVNTFATKINMGVTFGFYNGLLSRGKKKHSAVSSAQNQTEFFGR